MKIGIITFHRVINYGGVLQAYALQQVIKKIATSDSEIEIVDYVNPHFQQQYALISIKMFKHPRSLLMKLSLVNYKRQRNRKFNNFISKHVILGKKKINKKDLNIECAKYDKLITGSDQVWNLECTGNDFTYFLEMECNAKKYSYAASFAIDELSSVYIDRIKENLKKYRRISVREENGVAIVKDLLGKSVEVMPDPTFLIEAKQWRMLEENPKVLPDKYNLIIQMGGSIEVLRKHVEKLSDNIPIVYINLAQKPIKGMINICMASPEEWLYIIDHAENIITNSFHGCIFSVLFHKSFYYELTKGKNSNSRIVSLAKMLGLENRNVERLYMNTKRETINYDEVEVKLKGLRQVAKQYLSEIIGE